VLFACSFAAALFAIPSFPQSPQQTNAGTKQGDQKAPALRVLTRLVQISVIAQDGDGMPVMGLKKEDFTILDAGQPQKINFFTEQSNQNLTMTASTANTSINTFSNRFEQKPNAPTSATVILMDLRNTHALDMAYARKQVGAFLSELQPQDRIALYTLSSKLSILHDFTRIPLRSCGRWALIKTQKILESARANRTPPTPAMRTWTPRLTPPTRELPSFI